MSLEIHCVSSTRAIVGESPVWDPRDEALWWTDIKGRIVHRYDPKTAEDRLYPMPIRVGALAPRASGGFILAAEHGFWAWTPGRRPPEHIVDVEADRPDNRMNDGACDRQGRFVAASMSLHPDRLATAACWRLDASLQPELLVDGLRVGNGIAFSPAGDMLHLAETMTGDVWRLGYGAHSALGEREPFLAFTEAAGKPDGATIDSDGFYWVAGVYGGKLHRFAPDGRLDRSIDLPIPTPTCARFGGADMRDLYITSMGENEADPAGRLFVIRGLGVQGLPETPFAG